MPSGRRHYRITEADVLSAHQRALLTGGREGIADYGLIQSAIARPYNGYYRPIWKKAAALLQSMAGNHGFIDGNKRTALLLCDLLITESGYELVPLDEGESLEFSFEELIIAVVTHTVTLDEACNWFRERVREPF